MRVVLGEQWRRQQEQEQEQEERGAVTHCTTLQPLYTALPHYGALTQLARLSSLAYMRSSTVTPAEQAEYDTARAAVQEEDDLSIREPSSASSQLLASDRQQSLLRELIVLHAFAFAVMSAQAIAYGVVGADTRTQITVGFPSYSQQQALTKPEMRVVSRMSVAKYIISSLTLSSADHLVTVLCMWLRPKSMQWLFFTIR
jgi:hypothetical protein